MSPSCKIENMKTILVSIFVIFFSTVYINDCTAQDRKLLDSLQLLVQQTNNDTTKIKIYGDICWAYATTRKKLDTAGYVCRHYLPVIQ